MGKKWSWSYAIIRAMDGYVFTGYGWSGNRNCAMMYSTPKRAQHDLDWFRNRGVVCGLYDLNKPETIPVVDFKPSTGV